MQQRHQHGRNNLRRLFGLLATASFLMGTAQARIGDTEEQIRTRYGKAITVLPSRPSDVGVTKCYLSGGFSLAVTYLNGHSVRETLLKSDGSKITKGEIQHLINAHARATAKGVEPVAGPENVTASVQVWRSTDQRSRVAIYDSRTGALFITTQQFIDLTNAKSRQVTIRANPGGLGGLPRNMQLFDKSSAARLRDAQSKKPATPAK